MVSKKKSKNLCLEDLVQYIFRELHISKNYWDIELLSTDNWIGIRVIHKKSRSRLDKRVVYKSEIELKRALLAAVQLAMSEIKYISE